MYLRLPAFSPQGTVSPQPMMQFWDDPDPPSDVSKEMDTWRSIARPHHTLLSLDDARTFLHSKFGAPTAALLDRCPHPAVQSDLARLGWLAVHGGLYVDADARMRGAFEGLYPQFGGSTVLWFRTRAAALSVINGFIAAPPAAPVVLAAFDAACQRLGSGQPMHVFDYAGPTLWTQTVLQMFNEGVLNNVATLSDHFVASSILGQINAQYKSSNRNWRMWMKETGHGAG